jgi:2-keto-4-pentenoate hydratase/2-oxohepta-3-ene-1,7-dioic acid hydratase in catechol pathway
MRLARIRQNGRTVSAAALNDRELVLTQWLVPAAPADDPVALLAEAHWAAELRQALANLAAALAAGQVSAAWLRAQGWLVAAELVTFAPPVAQPSKVVCVALNYRAHAAEGNQAPPPEPALFFKAPSTLVGHHAEVIAPAASQRVDYEIELGVVIGRTAQRLTADNWAEAVLAYTIINDVTARDLQLAAIQSGIPWDRTKSFDTFGPVGPWLVTPDEVPDPQNLALELKVDGETRQSANTRDMIFPLRELLPYITDGITLERGDLIATGTPEGIGPVPHGAVMHATVEKLGTLSNPVRYPHQAAA